MNAEMINIPVKIMSFLAVVFDVGVRDGRSEDLVGDLVRKDKRQRYAAALFDLNRRDSVLNGPTCGRGRVWADLHGERLTARHPVNDNHVVVLVRDVRVEFGSQLCCGVRQLTAPSSKLHAPVLASGLTKIVDRVIDLGRDASG